MPVPIAIACFMWRVNKMSNTTYGSIPKDTLAEVLLYLADKEIFPSLKALGTVSPAMLKSALKDLAQKLKQEARNEAPLEEMEKLEKSLKKPHQEILSELQPEEKERLLRSFLN
jgi:hypothetical protein